MSSTDGVDLNALNYTILVPYNGTVPTGGDSLHEDLNIFYNVGFSPSPSTTSSKLTTLSQS